MNQQKRFIDLHEAARISGVKRSTWQKKIMRGEGPRIYKLGKSKSAPVRYDLDEFILWIQSQAVGGHADALCSPRIVSEGGMNKSTLTPNRFLTGLKLMDEKIIPVHDPIQDRTIVIESRGFHGNCERWAILKYEASGPLCCLNRDGEWEHEPLPSYRDDAFLDRCRYYSVEEAVAMLEKQAKKP